MGGTYNEPNTNLTSAETDDPELRATASASSATCSAGDPATAWQLDVFGHDPQFPGMAADAGLTSSSWARGPFHQWGPMLPRRRRAGGRPADAVPQRVRVDRAQSGAALLTHYMPAHYSAGWWMDSARDARRRPRTRRTPLRRAEDGRRDAATCCFPSAPTTRRRTSGSPRSTATGTPGTPGRGSSVRSRATSSPRCVPNWPQRGAPAVAADPRHEPDLHRQGRLVHRHQAGATAPPRHAVLDAEQFATFAACCGRAVSRTPRSPRRGCSWPTAPTTTRSPARNPTRSTSTCSPAGARRGSSARRPATTRWRCCPVRSTARWWCGIRWRTTGPTSSRSSLDEAGRRRGAGRSTHEGNELPVLVERRRPRRSAGWPATCRRWDGGPTGWLRLRPPRAGSRSTVTQIANEHYRLRVDPARGGGVESLIERVGPRTDRRRAGRQRTRGLRRVSGASARRARDLASAAQRTRGRIFGGRRHGAGLPLRRSANGWWCGGASTNCSATPRP